MVIIDKGGEAVRKGLPVKMVFGGTLIKEILVCAVTPHETNAVNGTAAIFHKMRPLLIHIDLFILSAVCQNIAVGIKKDHRIVKAVPALIQDLLIITLFGSGSYRSIPILIEIKNTLDNFKCFVKIVCLSDLMMSFSHWQITSFPLGNT